MIQFLKGVCTVRSKKEAKRGEYFINLVQITLIDVFMTTQISNTATITRTTTTASTTTTTTTITTTIWLSNFIQPIHSFIRYFTIQFNF